MTLRKVRARCEAIVAGIDVPTPFDLGAVVTQLSADRGRPIHLMPFPLPAGAPCGVCVATDTADYIVVTDAAVGTQRDHIALHELAHLLLEHSLHALTDPDASRTLLPHLDPAVVRRMYARTNYSTRQEAEAELLASLIRRKGGLWLARTPEPAGPAGPADAAVERLGRSLEHGSGRG